jgi:cytochrome c553
MPRSAIRWSGGIALLLLASAALDAGGWAVITVVKTPETVTVGQPVTVTYAVRQHGQRLVGGLQGRIEARFGGTLIHATANALPEDGHYAATLTLPHAGTWTLDIASGFSGSSGRLALRAVAPGASVAPLSPVERGGRLLVSKGCVTCHLEGMSSAPALRASGYEPDYLTQFLRRPPTGQKDEWRMPDLRLDEAEIAALVAFLNAGRSPGASATSTSGPADTAVPACTVTHPNGRGTFLEDALPDLYGNALISTG